MTLSAGQLYRRAMRIAHACGELHKELEPEIDAQSASADRRDLYALAEETRDRFTAMAADVLQAL
jgi:hypothetical protein